MFIKILPRLLLAAVFCLFPLVAQADPVVITSGSLTYPGFVTASFQYNFAGQDLVVAGGTLAQEANGPQCVSLPCIGANPHFAAGLNGGGVVTYQGTTYPLIFLGPHLNMEFIADTVLLPPELWTSNAVMITTPFTFRGSLGGVSSGLTVTFTGQGFVQLLLTRTPGEEFLSQMREVNYTFLSPGTPLPQTQIQAVPEPATIFLLATGLLGIATRFRKH